MHTHPMTTHLPHRHESHGNHPMSFVAFALILTGFATAGLWLVHMASGSGGHAALYGVAAAIAFGGAATIFVTLTRRIHHSPLLPDNTDAETDRYLHEYRD
jgi:hypothetical protein